MTYKDKRKYKHQIQRKYMKLPLSTKTLLPLSIKSPKTYSPFLLQIAKGNGNINHQRVEEVEMHSCSWQNQLVRQQPQSTTHPKAIHELLE